MSTQIKQFQTKLKQNSKNDCKIYFEDLLENDPDNLIIKSFLILSSLQNFNSLSNLETICSELPKIQKTTSKVLIEELENGFKISKSHKMYFYLIKA